MAKHASKIYNQRFYDRNCSIHLDYEPEIKVEKKSIGNFNQLMKKRKYRQDFFVYYVFSGFNK